MMSFSAELKTKLNELGELISEIQDYDDQDRGYIASRIKTVYKEIMQIIGDDNGQS